MKFRSQPPGLRPLSACSALLLPAIYTCAIASPTVLDEAAQEARLVTVGSATELTAEDPLMEMVDTPLIDEVGLRVAAVRVWSVAKEFWRDSDRRDEDFAHRGAWMKAAVFSALGHLESGEGVTRQFEDRLDPQAPRRFIGALNQAIATTGSPDPTVQLAVSGTLARRADLKSPSLIWPGVCNP